MAQSSHPVPSLPLKPSSRSWCPLIAPAADSSNLDKGKDTLVGDTIVSDNNNTKQLYQQKQTTTTVMPARTTKCQREQQNASVYLARSIWRSADEKLPLVVKRQT